MIRTTALLLFAALLGQAPDPAAFHTTARFSVGTTQFHLTTAVATIQPRRGASGYSWLRVSFYAFPLTSADIASVARGRTDTLDARWQKTSNNAAIYNVSHAQLQLTIDDTDRKIWQIDEAVPGHTCTIAASDHEAAALVQDYHFDGSTLRLNARGANLCMGMGFDVQLAVPVYPAAR
jgi:hypothetical protein